MQVVIPRKTTTLNVTILLECVGSSLLVLLSKEPTAEQPVQEAGVLCGGRALLRHRALTGVLWGWQLIG